MIHWDKWGEVCNSCPETSLTDSRTAKAQGRLNYCPFRYISPVVIEFYLTIETRNKNKKHFFYLKKYAISMHTCAYVFSAHTHLTNALQLFSFSSLHFLLCLSAVSLPSLSFLFSSPSQDPSKESFLTSFPWWSSVSLFSVLPFDLFLN